MNQTEDKAGDGGEQLGAAELLGEVNALRRRTTAAARAYWLPLLLFGAVIAASVAFYQRLAPSRSAPLRPSAPVRCTPVVNHPCHVGVAYFTTHISALGYYWQIALPIGVVLTVLWYRWRGSRVGLRTPPGAFLITGLVLSELVLLVPILGSQARPGPLHYIHRAGAVVVIAALLWVLAWAERSPALAVITGIYLVAAVAAGIATNGGISGVSTGAADISLASSRLLGLLPAVILLAAGAVTLLIQRLRLRTEP